MLEALPATAAVAAPRNSGTLPSKPGTGERERAFGESLMARRLGNVGISGVEDCKSGEELNKEVGCIIW